MGTQRRGQAQAQQQRGAVSNDQAETTRLQVLGNPAQLAEMRDRFPSLAAVINDSNRFREAWQEMLNADQNRERERQEQMRLLNEDPFNVEAQRKIEEMIRQESVQENLHFAYEHNPEGMSINVEVLLLKFCELIDSYSVWHGYHAVCTRRGQQAPCEGFR